MGNIKKISVVSNTHWDREFRQSFEKTRRNLLTMLDITLDILQNDNSYHSFTMDGHAIMIDDYLEMRPERVELVKKLVLEGRLILGPYYTLAEQFSISHEALIRNLQFGRKTVEKYGGTSGTVAYTPSSWGQTGQYPQILKDFDLDKMMFYRGISHHEADAEYIWSAPDGTKMLASRFALYCRYNWYYQVHRGVTKGRVFAKDYNWGEFDESPVRSANYADINGTGYELTNPSKNVDTSKVAQYIEDMLEEEKGHFTTPIFLAMNGHDISVAFPYESEVIKAAQQALAGKYEIEHTDLEGFWADAEKFLDRSKMPVLTGERRSYLKEGKWTFLFPGTISARTYLKQQDFDAYTRLVYFAEPLAALASILGGNSNLRYLDRGWDHLLQNHTHDANGGCAPDNVCKDIEYRYRKVCDISDIITDDSLKYIAENLSPKGQNSGEMQLVVYNSLPFKRNVITKLDLELPIDSSSFEIEGAEVQQLTSEKSSVFMDSVWDVPTIMDTSHYTAYARFEDVPPMGYKTYKVIGAHEKRGGDTIVTCDGVLENSKIKVTVNQNGTADILNKNTGKIYSGINYFTSQGEVGNAWKHVAPENDIKYNTKGVSCTMATTLNGSIAGTISVKSGLELPSDISRTSFNCMPISVDYTLMTDSDSLMVRVTVDNTVKDHWFRANLPTGIRAEHSVADSHFDIVKRPTAIPDSTGWVEQAFGTHPLRTFAAVCEDDNGIAIMPKGLYEYELSESGDLALTLIRGCRIKLAVSEEKVTELADEGVQCQGVRTFEYAININDGDFSVLPNKAAELFTDIKCVLAGRGRGELPLEGSFFSVDNSKLHVTAVRPVQDGIIIRMYNGTEEEQAFIFNFGVSVKKIYKCNMNEQITEECTNTNIVGAKKIQTYLIKVG